RAARHTSSTARTSTLEFPLHPTAQGQEAAQRSERLPRVRKSRRLPRIVLVCLVALAATASVADARIEAGMSPGDQASGVIAEAPPLPRAADFTGPSILDTRLSATAYALTRRIGAPKSVDVACWSKAEWSEIATDGDPLYSTTGLYVEDMPHWVHLSPKVCRA